MAQLVNYISFPYTQDQRDQSTCGVNVIFISLAMQAPNVLIHIALRLLTDGHCKQPIEIATNENIKAACDNLAKLFNQSLKNSQAHLKGGYVPYSFAANWLHDLTTPNDLVQFLHNFGCDSITDATKFVDTCATRSYESFLGWQYGKKPSPNDKRISSGFTEDLDFLLTQFDDRNGMPAKSCIIFIDSILLEKLLARALEYNEDAYVNAIKNEPLRKYFGINIEHYAVLKNITYNEGYNSVLDLVIYTYGKEIKARIAKNDLEAKWLGYISFEFPERLKLATLHELHTQESYSLSMSTPKLRNT